MGIFGHMIFELLNHLFQSYEHERGKILWGIRLTFLGLVLTLFGLFIGVAALIQGANSSLFVGVVIFVVVGIPFLILGIYYLKKPEKANKSLVLENSQTKINNIVDIIGAENYSSLRWGWILTTLGILFTFFGLSWLCWGIYSFIDPPQDFQPKDLLLIAIIAGDPALLIGGVLLLVGIRRIKSVSRSVTTNTQNKKAIGNNRRSGWILAGFGGLCSLWGVSFIVLAIINSFLLPQTDRNISDTQQSIQCAILGLVIGFPLLFTGVWSIIYTGAIKKKNVENR